MKGGNEFHRLNSELQVLQAGLAQAVPLPRHLEKGVFAFRLLADRCHNFEMLGRAICWILFNFHRLEMERTVTATVRHMVMGKSKASNSMHRVTPSRRRPLFPLPLGRFSKVCEAAQLSCLADFCTSHFAGITAAEVWAALGILGLNGTAGFDRAAIERKPTLIQEKAIENIGRSTTRVLS